MKSFHLLLAGCLLVGLLLNSSLAYSQCQSAVALTKKINCSAGISNGQIKIKVDSKGAYDLRLIEYDSRGEKNVESQSGAGTASYHFKNLRGDIFYKVEVIFRTEEKFLCKSRVLDNIFLTDKE